MPHKQAMRYRLRSSASRYAAAERKAQAQRDAGIPDREPDQRVTWWIDLRPIGGPWWRCEPRIGYISYLVYAEPGGERVMCGPPKTILARAAALLPRVMSARAAAG
jgi:hypothetical protein